MHTRLDSSVSKVTGYNLEDRGSIPGRDRNSPLLLHVHIGSGTQPAFHPMGTMDFLPGRGGGVKWPEPEVVYPLPSSTGTRQRIR
jgi:hypothetical protein